MATINVTYYDLDGAEMECSVRADDEAAALGVVLDELGDNILSDSPFAIWRERTPRRKAAGPRKGASGGKMLSGPMPTGEVLEDDDEELQLLPPDSEAPPAVAQLLSNLDMPLERPTL